MNVPWGWLTAIDASHCDATAINCRETIQLFIDELLDRIEMVKIGDLNIFWCETHDPKKVGLSCYQLLQDSNVSAHFCPADRNSAFMDIFSCKKYDPALTVEIFEKYFKPEKINHSVIERRIP